MGIGEWIEEKGMIDWLEDNVGYITVVFIVGLLALLIYASKKEGEEQARVCDEAKAIARTSADKLAAIRICYDLDRPNTTVITQPVYVR